MKTILITLFLGLSICQFSNAQIIDSLPYFKQDLILKNTIKPLFKGLTTPEGNSMAIQAMDRNFQPPVSGWIRDSMFHHLRGILGSVEYQDGDDLLARKTVKMFSAKHSNYLDSNFVVAIFKMPKGKSLKTRGAYDPLRTLKLSPRIASSPDKFFALLIVEKSSKEYKVYPFADPDIGVSAEVGVGDFKGSDEELQALKTANKFLKAIHQNDRKAFRSLFSDDILNSQVWTDMRPFSNYRNLPEYSSNNLEFVRVVSFENQAGWRGHFSEHIAVYKLPKGYKVSGLRAPTDYFNPVVFPALDGSSKEPAYISSSPGFNKPEEGSIIGGPLIGTLIGDEDPSEYITILLRKEKGTNNFNIGMPPTLK